MYHITLFLFKKTDLNSRWRISRRPPSRSTLPYGFPLGLVCTHVVVINFFSLTRSLQGVVMHLLLCTCRQWWATFQHAISGITSSKEQLIYCVWSFCATSFLGVKFYGRFRYELIVTSLVR